MNSILEIMLFSCEQECLRICRKSVSNVAAGNVSWGAQVPSRLYAQENAVSSLGTSRLARVKMILVYLFFCTRRH